ncbi:MAG: DUF4411 family protein [Moraxellaceae bacterium]|nr:DUF4411 family protein [Moraxellaceae bacterium]MDZ4387736.1 DUF4411 family protein [Moraxellaceae bacterium]
MRYLLDSNTYIQAKNQYYNMSFCPGYWSWLDAKFEAGEVGSIEFIGKELKDGNDELATWAKARNEHFLKHDDDATQEVFADIVNFVMTQDFMPANRDAFLEKGDPWLIAKAKTLGATLVTHEATVTPTTRRVKIPNICQEFGVQCISTFDMLRDLMPRFVLEEST